MCGNSPEPHSLECEVKFALGSITTNKVPAGDGIPGDLYENPKRQYCSSAALNMPANLENSAWPQDWKGSVSFQSLKKAMPRMFKLLKNCPHFTC